MSRWLTSTSFSMLKNRHLDGRRRNFKGMLLSLMIDPDDFFFVYLFCPSYFVEPCGGSYAWI